METIYNIIAIAGGVISLVTTVIAWYKAVKNGNKAKAEEAKNAISAEIKKLVANAEVTFEAWDKSLKASGTGTAGNMKKRDVVMALKTFCLEKGYTWNEQEMNEAIESEVAFTKAVNAKEAN
jgi:hypothetical protein